MAPVSYASSVKQRESYERLAADRGLLLDASPAHLLPLGKKCVILDRPRCQDS